MHSKLCLTLGELALVCGIALLSTQCAATEHKAEPTTPPNTEEMMAKMMELGTPGPEHADFARQVGDWEQTYKHRMGPDQPWMEFKGTSTIKTIFGGRFLVEDVDMRMEWEGQPMPMQGLNIVGYDKLHKEYISFWTDSMSTWWVTLRGKKDASGNTDLRGTMDDGMGERPFRIVIKHHGDDTVEMEMYDTIPNQGETLMMTSVSKRKK
jgi:uncharacterized protein DUF1579